MADCTQPGCNGQILDGYCDVCGMAASAVPATASASAIAGQPGGNGPSAALSSAGAAALSMRTPSGRVTSSRLGTVPLGSQRTTSGSRRTQRLGVRRSGSTSLGAGLVSVPPVPTLDPAAALMDPAVVAERKRYCANCQSPVGRAKGDQPGRTKGFCPKCRTPFDFDPRLKPGMLVGGQYEVAGCLAHGGMGWIYLARDRNVNGRWVVLKGLLNAGDPDASRAAVAEKQYLAEVEHPLIVEIYNFVTAPDGASYIVMEYVGGTSLNDLIRQRTSQQGTYSPLPVDQAIAYMVEVLPAFSYLHASGLLYCDFKPANVIQVAESVKLIDLGGVRRIGDDETPIYGTVGFQAPEVPRDGCTIASDIYTVGRTLAVLVFEFQGSTNEYVDRLPTPEQVPLFAEHDSLYRLLLRSTATNPEDRFQSADELREQLLGVLREVTSRDDGDFRSVPSTYFDTPAISSDELGWAELPGLRADVTDPMASWLSGITSDDPARLVSLLDGAPEQTAAVRLARARAALAVGDVTRAKAECDALLELDPWDWRAVWTNGLAALAGGDVPGAVSAFNSVYGQVPGELAPKLALARACELADEREVAGRLYAVCSRTDGAYLPPAQFGLARLALADGRRADALAALGRIPPVSRAYGESRRQRASLLVGDGAATPDDLAAASVEVDRAGLAPRERTALQIEILEAALTAASSGGGDPSARVADVSMTVPEVRVGLERAYRSAARLSDDPAERIAFVDRANAVRPRTLT
ncbi:MAG: tetratricopeptide repeat protein [Ilumatobacteraceae bacterium]